MICAVRTSTSHLQQYPGICLNPKLNIQGQSFFFFGLGFFFCFLLASTPSTELELTTMRDQDLSQDQDPQPIPPGAPKTKDFQFFFKVNVLPPFLGPQLPPASPFKLFRRGLFYIKLLRCKAVTNLLNIYSTFLPFQVLC